MLLKNNNNNGYSHMLEAILLFMHAYYGWVSSLRAKMGSLSLNYLIGFSRLRLKYKDENK